MAASNERVMELLGKVPVGLLAAVYLGYQGYQFYAFRNFDESPLLQKQAEIRDLNSNIEVMNKKLIEAKKFQSELDRRREALRSLAEELGNMRASLSEDFNVPEMIRTMTLEANRVGLAVESFQPRAEVQKQYYVEKGFTMKFRGVFVQMLVFMDRVAALKRIIRVGSMTVYPSGPQSAKYVDLEGQVDLQVFKYSGTAADQLGQGSSAPQSKSGAPSGK